MPLPVADGESASGSCPMCDITCNNRAFLWGIQGSRPATWFTRLDLTAMSLAYNPGYSPSNVKKWKGD